MNNHAAMIKPFWQSKTIAANVLLFLTYAIAWEPLTVSVDPELLALIGAALNIGLRFVTHQAVAVK